MISRLLEALFAGSAHWWEPARAADLTQRPSRSHTHHMSNRTGTVTLTVTTGAVHRRTVISTTTVEAVLPKERRDAKALVKIAGITLDRGQTVTVSHPGYSFGVTPSDLR